jgi:hypothetical protein
MTARRKFLRVAVWIKQWCPNFLPRAHGRESLDGRHRRYHLGKAGLAIRHVGSLRAPFSSIRRTAAIVGARCPEQVNRWTDAAVDLADFGRSGTAPKSRVVCHY